MVAEEAQLQVLHQQKLYQRVVAPFDGVITQRNIDIGSLVQADATSGTFMFTIMQGNVIRTQVFVPQDEAFGLKPGVEAVVHVPEIPDRSFPGKVTRIADALQPGSRTLLTEIDIPNPDGALAPGIYCTVELQIPRKTPSFMVSADAIIFNADGVQVAVVENGVVHLRKVSVRARSRVGGRGQQRRQGGRSGDPQPRRRSGRRQQGAGPHRGGADVLSRAGQPAGGPILKRYLMVGRATRTYVFCTTAHRAYSLAGGVYVAVERTARATPCSPRQGGAAPSGSLAEA